MSFPEEKKDASSFHEFEAQVPDTHLKVQLPPALAALSPEELAHVDRRATRKLDLLLMPILIVLYILNFLDRNNVATAKIGGITKDLHMTDQQFSTAVAVLFAGYVSLQIPSNMVASRVSKPGLYICFMCGLWGMVSAFTGAVHSYAGLCVTRTLLGFTEAAFFPGAVYLLSTFYTRQQLAFRTGILYSGSQIGNAFGGLFALAILEMDGLHGLQGWRWLFIVEGAMTVGIAILFAFFIPNTPTSMRWLSEVEREQLLYRLEMDKGTKDGSEELSNWGAFRLAVTDPKAWLLCLALTLNFVASAVTNFFSIVVSSLGYNRTTTLAITAPPYILCVLCITLNGWHSDKKRERTLHIVGPFLLCIVANVIAVATTNVAARFVSIMLLPASFYAPAIVLISWISSTIVGPNAKRAISIALINCVANTSNIWTSYVYQFDSPRYVPAFIMNIAACVLVILVVFFIRWYLTRLNRRIERGDDLGIQGPSQVQRDAGFRFVL